MGYLVNKSYYDKNAELLLIKSAKQGFVKAQYRLLKWYMMASEGYLTDHLLNKVDLPSSKEKMLLWMNKLVDEGDPRMQNIVGKAYSEGKYGFEKNYYKAKDLYEKSANQGYALGIANLAKCYQKGLGVSKDMNKAIYLYDLAGQKGDGDAYIVLRDLYKNGDENIPEDSSKAQEYNGKAHQVGPLIDEVELWLMMSI